MGQLTHWSHVDSMIELIVSFRAYLKNLKDLNHRLSTICNKATDKFQDKATCCIVKFMKG